MIHFDDAHKRVHLPDDRRVVAILRRRYIIWVIVLIVFPIALAWLQVLVFGIHSAFAPVAGITGSGPSGAPRGFPVWIRWTHFANLLFLFFAGAQRPFNPHGSPAIVLEQRLYAGVGMATSHAADRS